ncbi:MAG: hypothetical protein AAB316_22590 [Bacteroidota bacterium]
MFALINDDERTEALRSIAFNLGMEFCEKDEYGLRSLLKDFKLFDQGHSKRVYNLMEKSSGYLEEKFHIMDYKYTISANNSSKTYRQTVFFINSKRLALPQMLLKPESFFNKVGAWFGMQDIDFVEHPVFSEKYLLQGEDEARIRRSLPEEVIRFFTVEQDWCLECLGYFMILYRQDSLAAPGYVEMLYKKGLSLYEHLKSQEPEI